MRLLQLDDDNNLRLTRVLSNHEVPVQYAILSHTWSVHEEDEVTFVDLQVGPSQYRDKVGYKKIEFCGEQAKRDGIKYFWVDTCCINRADLTELSESITSMFRWYHQAAKCYAYISDLLLDEDDGEQLQHQWEPAFRTSEWFKRGWTLQELLAPASVEFFSREGRVIGSKESLETLIHDITQIPIPALRGDSLSQFSVDERFRWTNGRRTRKVEDMAYCLLGIFDVSMSLRYGEGEKALIRLRNKAGGLPKNISQTDFLAWLAPCRPQEIHAKVAASRHPDTGTFVTTGPLKPWLTNQSGYSSLMWITGKSGTGKTTLFSHIVEATKALVHSTPAAALAYHYCAFSDSNSQQLINILGSLLVQTATWQSDILKDVKEVFEKDQARKQNKTLQVWELEQVLVRHMATFDTVIFLVDALDESEDFFEVHACITKLLQRLPNLKVLVTSTRRVPNTNRDRSFRLIEIQIDPSEDIRTLVEDRLSKHSTLQHLSAACKATIRSMLIGRADRSFRWVSLILENLCRQRTGKAVLAALAQMPQGLNDTYKDMLKRIPSTDRAIARNALLWTSFAMRPMTLLELSEAVVLEDSDTTLDQDSRLCRPTIILEVCHGFLEYDTRTDIVRLAHSSVKDYLLSNFVRSSDDAYFSLEFRQGNQALMRKCLTYLMFDNFKPGITMRSQFEGPLHRQRDFPLLKYAAHYWGRHASFATQSEWDLAKKLFSTRRLPCGGNYGVWASFIMPEYDMTTAVNTEPLYYAASLGIIPLVRGLLSGDMSIDIERPGGRVGSTALQVACFRGRKEAAELLLAAGADFWTEDPGSSQPAWFWALSSGWTIMVDTMIQQRPEIAAQASVDSEKIRRAGIWLKYMRGRYMVDSGGDCSGA